jgi:RNA polymerase sigma-70 factor (ECF subfamily)
VDEASDSELIQRSFSEPRLFEGVFERHYDAIRRYSQRRVGMTEGEEIAASTFETAFAHRSHFDSNRFTSARPWLMGIANNLVRGHVRHGAVRARHWPPLSIALQGSEPEPGLEGIEAIEAWPALRAALLEIPLSDRETFLFHVLSDLSYAEVAEVMSIPIGTVRSRINRVRRTLRELMEPAEPINSGKQELETEG